MVEALSVVLDHRQSRVKQKPVATCVNHREWEIALMNGCVLEPVTGDLILRPRAWESSWYTSNSGAYAKLAKADFTGLTSAYWTAYDRFNRGSGKTFLISYQGFPNSEVGLTSAMSANQPMHCSVHSYGDGSDREIFRCGWSDSGVYTAGVGVRFFASGKAWVYRNGDFIAEGEFDPSASNAANILYEISLIPCRRRDLLIVTNAGTGFVVTFEDIAETDTTAIITPAEKFWFQVPTGTPNVQIAKLKFATSGTGYGLKSSFKRDPDATSSSTFLVPVFGSGSASASFVHPTSLTTTTGKDIRLAVSLTGSGDTTPFVKGAFGYWNAVTADTPDAGVDLEEWLLHAQLTVPDDPGGVSASVLLKSPYAIEQAGVAKLRTIGNRPAKLSFGGLKVIDGRTEGGAWDDAVSDETRRFEQAIRDPWKVLEKTTIDDPWPLDTRNFVVAIKEIVDYALKGVSYDLESTTFEIPSVPGDEWTYQIEAGETCANALRRLFETFAATWIYGFKPTATGIKFYGKSPAGIGATPKARLYLLRGDADDESVDPLETRRVLVRHFHEDILEIEANEIYVTGYDLQSGRPFVKSHRDAYSIDPTVAVSMRNDNWHGEVLTVGIQDPSINSKEAASDALDYLIPRLTKPRRLTQLETQLLFYMEGSTRVPVWRGDVIEIVNVADNPGTSTYRVLSLDAEFHAEIGLDDDLETRNTRYVAEEIIV